MQNAVTAIMQNGKEKTNPEKLMNTVLFYFVPKCLHIIT